MAAGNCNAQYEQRMVIRSIQHPNQVKYLIQMLIDQYAANKV